MKKWFVLLFTCLTLALMAGCGHASEDPASTDGSTPGSTPEATGGEAGSGADTDDTKGPEQPGELQTVSLNSGTEGIRILGERFLAGDEQLNLDWTCSGLEFVLDSRGGDLTIHAETSAPAYFRVWIDGREWENAQGELYYEVAGRQDIVVPALPEGEHTVRVLKVTGYTLSRAQLTGMSFYGSLLTGKTPPANDLYIEFVGDSICCGWGNIGAHTGAYTDQDGSQAYPYMIAEQMQADYAVTALSGQGLLCGAPGMTNGYLYASPLRDASTAYHFPRKADIVVVNIGTNDYGYREQYGIDEEKFGQAYLAFLKTVYEKNEGCQIYCLYNAMNDTFSQAILEACREVGGEAAGVYSFEMTRTAAGGHPTLAEHSTYAARIASYINQTKENPITGTFGEPAGGGWGADEDGMFVISSADDMLAFAASAEANGWYEGKVVELSADIDMNGVEWVPLAYFKGTLEGNAHAIRNLVCGSSNAGAGVIAAIDGATIRNIRFEACSCVDEANTIAGLVTYASGGTSVFENVFADFTVKGSLSGGKGIGGYIGRVDNLVSVEFRNCVSTGTISGLTGIGGFIGNAETGSSVTMTDCLFTGVLVSDNHAAGMIGRSAGAVTLTRCVSMGRFEADAVTDPVYSRAGLLFLYNQDFDADKTMFPTAQEVILTDCYAVVDNVLSLYPVSSHTVNAGLRRFHLTVFYTGVDGPVYDNADGELANQVINDELAGDAVIRLLALGEEVRFSAEAFGKYEAFAGWVLTGEQVSYSETGRLDGIMPAPVAGLLGLETKPSAG